MSAPPEDTPPPPRWHAWVALLGVAAGLVLLLAWLFPGALASTDDRLRVVYLIALLALVSGGVVASRRTRWRKTLRDAAIWLAIGVLLVGGYGFRYELASFAERVMGELMPTRGVVTGEAAVVFRAGRNGHFRIDATVDGAPVRFLLDTGASDVVLTPADAERIGFDLDRLAFSKVYATANGLVRVAPVTLREIAIGPIRLADVGAAVNQAPMPSSLLGVSFLERLGGYEVSDGSLTLRQ